MAKATSPSYPPFGMVEIVPDKSDPQKSSLKSPIDSHSADNILVYCERPNLRRLTYYTVENLDGKYFWITFNTCPKRGITQPFELGDFGMADPSDPNTFRSVDHEIGADAGQALMVVAKQGNRADPPVITYSVYTKNQQGTTVSILNIDPDGTLDC